MHAEKLNVLRCRPLFFPVFNFKMPGSCLPVSCEKTRCTIFLPFPPFFNEVKVYEKSYISIYLRQMAYSGVPLRPEMEEL